MTATGSDQLNQWLSAIDDYSLGKKDIQKGLASSAESPEEAVNRLIQPNATLYKGAHSDRGEDTRKARAAFLAYLHNVLQEMPPAKKVNGKKPLVTMEAMLGKEGLELYHAAIAEESRSRNFRDAVFLKSTKHYDGPKWAKKLVMWVAGPSASGKTFGAGGAVEEMKSRMPTVPGDNSGNTVVSVDGGIESEMSQMRQMVLQVGLTKGFKGINDLHKHTKLNTKSLVQSSAKAMSNLSLLIPETFAGSVLKGFKRKLMTAFNEDPNVVQAFSEVTAEEGKSKEFQVSVKQMGESRAWLADDENFDQNAIKMNNRDIGCESKKYGANGFKLGKYASKVAREFFKKLNPNGIYIKITNDLVFVHVNKHGAWDISKSDEPAEFKLSRRDFNAYVAENAKHLALPDSDHLPLDIKAWHKARMEARQLAPSMAQAMSISLLVSKNKANDYMRKLNAVRERMQSKAKGALSRRHSVSDIQQPIVPPPFSVEARQRSQSLTNSSSAEVSQINANKSRDRALTFDFGHGKAVERTLREITHPHETPVSQDNESNKNRDKFRK